MTKINTREPEIDRIGRETFINLFLAAGRLTDEVEAVCKAQDLTMAHYTALWVVCLSDGDPQKGVPMGAIADGLFTRASDVTRLVDRLTKAGHLERFPSEHDRRVVLVKATQSGRDLFLRLTADIKSLHREQWSALSHSELHQLLALLAKVYWREEAPSNKHPLEGMPPILAASSD